MTYFVAFEINRGAVKHLRLVSACAVLFSALSQEAFPVIAFNFFPALLQKASLGASLEVLSSCLGDLHTLLLIWPSVHVADLAWNGTCSTLECRQFQGCFLDVFLWTVLAPVQE